ncbi:MAG: efflux RND transporter periplasmic adaptor subunit [Opitutaceae bacterium]|nr:efflux RND transporter periplasmic adaptor subunit [Opitutaceae bacterium]
MDIARPDLAKKKRRKMTLYVGIGVLVLVIATIAISSLKPAAPAIDRNLVWVDTVKRGPMVRQVRGIGSLVPENIRIVTSRSAGRVDRIVLRAGAPVTPDSIIVELANPDVIQAAEAADSQLQAAEAEFTNLNVRLGSDLLAMESELARAKSEYKTSKLQAEVTEELFKDGLVSGLERRRTQVAAEDAATRHEIAKKRYAFTQESMQLQLAVKQAEVNRQRAQTQLRREECDALKVRAGLTGVLQTMALEVGEQIANGGVLARVADPTSLKAQVRIAETQAKDIVPGQLASIDTRNGIVEGRVARIDPSVQNGTVTVDVALTGTLPKGARPDLSIDGTIELERLPDVIFVGRPAFGQEHSTVGVFKLESDGDIAHRSPVKFGRASVNTIEVLDGLQPGDRVILSDMSQHDSTDRVRLN